MEALGGNGYVDEGPMPRLFRQSPLNAIWEGSGNVICLDVLRAASKDPAAVAAVRAELEAALGHDALYDAFCAEAALPALEAVVRGDASAARQAVGRIALGLQGSLLLRHGHPSVAAIFCAARFGGRGREDYGAIDPATADAHAAAVLERATPAIPAPSRL